MTLTQEEINKYNDFVDGLWKDINSKKSYSQKKFLIKLHNSVKKENSCCYNNNYNQNYHTNSYSSNNVHITENNISGGGSVCSLF